MIAVPLLILLLTARPAPPKPQPAPPIPYLDWGACPFECCTYGRWTATRATEVLRDRHAKSPVAFRLKAGERVDVSGGVVVTLRPGRIRATAPVTIGGPGNETRLHAGDVVFVLHYVGEGNHLLWFHGRAFSDELDLDKPGPIDRWKNLELLELPVAEWWFKVRNAAGKVGWSVRSEDFDGQDSCS
jgi:hypothetical protein